MISMSKKNNISFEDIDVNPNLKCPYCKNISTDHLKGSSHLVQSYVIIKTFYGKEYEIMQWFCVRCNSVLGYCLIPPKR